MYWVPESQWISVLRSGRVLFLWTFGFSWCVTPLFACASDSRALTLDGTWQLTEVIRPSQEASLISQNLNSFSKEAGTDEALSTELQIQGSSAILTVSKTPHRTLQWPTQNPPNDTDAPCKARFFFNVSYCCPKMQKLFLGTSLELSPEDQPAGCWGSSLQDLQMQVEAELPDTFQFAFSRTQTGLSQVTLQGPYIQPTLTLILRELQEQ